jgi:hypothetical protein
LKNTDYGGLGHDFFLRRKTVRRVCDRLPGRWCRRVPGDDILNAPLAEFSDYDGLRRALNACREQRDLSFERMDEITGAPSGYFAKLLGPRAIRRIGLQSLGWAFGGLGVKCVVVSDPEALAKVESRYAMRDKPHLAAVHGGAIEVQLNRGFLRKIGSKGGASRWGKLSPKKRSALAKRLNKIRWGKVKSKAKEQARRARQRKAAHKTRKEK